jgi:hypothetical protein
MLIPFKFQLSDKNQHISELIFELLHSAEKNVDLGYKIDLQHLEEIVKKGMTYNTFDMLVYNLNRELLKQYLETADEIKPHLKLILN